MKKHGSSRDLLIPAVADGTVRYGLHAQDDALITRVAPLPSVFALSFSVEPCGRCNPNNDDQFQYYDNGKSGADHIDPRVCAPTRQHDRASRPTSISRPQLGVLRRTCFIWYSASMVCTNLPLFDHFCHGEDWQYCTRSGPLRGGRVVGAMQHPKSGGFGSGSFASSAACRLSGHNERRAFSGRHHKSRSCLSVDGNDGRSVRSSPGLTGSSTGRCGFWAIEI